MTILQSGSKDFSADVGDTWDVIQTTSPNTTTGAFTFGIGLGNLAAGDVLEARIQEKDATAGTLRTVWQGSWSGAQSLAMVKIPWKLIYGWDFSMRQRSGTGRVVPWFIDSIT